MEERPFPAERLKLQKEEEILEADITATSTNSALGKFPLTWGYFCLRGPYTSSLLWDIACQGGHTFAGEKDQTTVTASEGEGHFSETHRDKFISQRDTS